MRWLVPLVVVLIAGCAAHTHGSVTFVSVAAGATVATHIEGGAGLAALLGLAVIAFSAENGGIYGTGSSRNAPEMAADRRVSEQDCTKPIDYSLGNIRCK